MIHINHGIFIDSAEERRANNDRLVEKKGLKTLVTTLVHSSS